MKTTNTKTSKNVINLNSENITTESLPKKSKLSVEDVKAQKNLKLIWSAYKKINKTNQTEFVKHKELNFSQGNFSQYLTGKVPLGMRATISLSKALECDPGDIREELRNDSLDNLTNKLAEQLLMAKNIIKKIEGYEYLTNEIEKTLSSPQLTVL